jgi:hypothetical protein
MLARARAKGIQVTVLAATILLLLLDLVLDEANKDEEEHDEEGDIDAKQCKAYIAIRLTLRRGGK